MQVLRIETFLQARIMLLDTISMDGVVQEQCKIRVEIEQRSTQKSIGLETVSGLHGFSVIQTGRSEAHAAAIVRVHVSKPGELPRRDKVQWNLSRRKEVVTAQIQLNAESFIVAQMPRVVTRNVVTLVTQRTAEGAGSSVPLVCQERGRFVERGTITKECSIVAK